MGILCVSGVRQCINMLRRFDAFLLMCDRQSRSRTRARREGSTDDGWQTQEEWQQSRGNGRRRADRPSGSFDPLFDAAQQTEYWEYRAEQIQRDAQRTARQAVRQAVSLTHVPYLTHVFSSRHIIAVR